MSTMTATVPRVVEKRSAVRTRTFTGNTPEEILDMLRSERFTGRVSVDMSQGGTCSVTAEDRCNLPYLTANNNSS